MQSFLTSSDDDGKDKPFFKAVQSFWSNMTWMAFYMLLRVYHRHKTDIRSKKNLLRARIVSTEDIGDS